MHAFSQKGKENQLKGNLFQHNKQISWCSNNLKLIVSLLLGCFEVLFGSEVLVESDPLWDLRHSADNSH